MLNPEQQAAVAHDHGPLLILAGAGSGKTTVLVSRAERLLRENVCTAKQLCVLTFTNKAARELKDRVAKRLGARSQGIWAGTFHSFGLQILRRFHQQAGLSREFGVLDSSDTGAVVKELLKDFNNAGKIAYDAETLLSMISDWRERGRQTAEDKEEEYEEAVEWVLPKYLKRLEHLGMVDFDSLILKPIELMRGNPEIREKIQSSFSQVMVDEFQDTNETQMKLIKLLVEPHKNITVVGDDDQSIYGWRGACIKNILDFPKLYTGCKVIALEQNYRSTQEILDVANSVIAKNAHRHKKVLRPKPGLHGSRPEVAVFQDENQEVESIAGEIQECFRRGYRKKDVAVLYRSNSQGAALEAELRSQNVPYVMSGGTAFFDRKETRDVLAYLRCAFRPNEVGLRRIFHAPPRGIGDKSVEALTHFSKDLHVPFVAAARRWREAGVDERAGKSLDDLFDFLDRLIPRLVNSERLLDLLHSQGYKTYLEKHSANALQATKRWKLVEIFTGILDRFIERGGRTAETIREFVDAMELRDALQDQKEDEDRVQLLTLHACKGLEFPVVFLMGVEEDILPHKTLGSDVSEERRLFYVGITRAQKELIMTRTARRRKHGKVIDAVPSRFLLEIPPALLTQRNGPRAVREESRKAMVAELFAKLDKLGEPKSP